MTDLLSEMPADLQQFVEATERRVIAERQRAEMEAERLKLERRRADDERAIRSMLESLTELCEMLLRLHENEVVPELSVVRLRFDVVGELMRVLLVILRQDHGEYDQEIARLERILGQALQQQERIGMDVNIRAERDVHTGDIGERIQKNVLVSGAVDLALQHLKEERVAEAESVLNTLPEDALDVAVAALSGPAAALRMVVEKVAGKIRVMRES